MDLKCYALPSPIVNLIINPIELIWAQVKGRVARRNKTFRLQDVKRLVVESLADVTPENWRDAVTHVEKVEKDYWVADRLQEEVVEQIVINIGPGSDNSDDSGDTDSVDDSGSGDDSGDGGDDSGNDGSDSSCNYLGNWQQRMTCILMS